jgi:hypothetical protein
MKIKIKKKGKGVLGKNGKPFAAPNILCISTADQPMCWSIPYTAHHLLTALGHPGIGSIELVDENNDKFLIEKG